MEGKKNLFEKINAIAAELRVSKDGKNKGLGFVYFNPDDINRSIVPLLLKHGVFIKFDLVVHERPEWYKATAEVCDVETNSNLLYSFDIREAVVQRAQGAQATGATITYAKRYLLMNIFNIADNKDDPDNDDKHENGKEKTIEDLRKVANASDEKQKAEIEKAIGKITKEQLGIINNFSVILELETFQETMKNAFLYYKVTKLADLTIEQADVVIKKLKKVVETNGTTSN